MKRTSLGWYRLVVLGCMLVVVTSCGTKEEKGKVLIR